MLNEYRTTSRNRCTSATFINNDSIASELEGAQILSPPMRRTLQTIIEKHGCS